MATIKTFTAGLDDRLLGELPRFFGGWRPALRELFQNAYRAGATRVAITFDRNILTFADDGCGCEDPALLVTGGQTGWDENRIVEPAGLGLFSLMDKDIVTYVEVESCGWKTRLDPERVLGKKPLTALPAQAGETGGIQAGLRLTICMTEARDLAEDIAATRGYYPFTVTLNGKDLPITLWQPRLELDTPVGKVGLRRLRGYVADRRAIWEYRAIGSEVLRDALNEAAEGDDLRKAINGYYGIHWFVDERCGVRPKLPDRNELVDNDALKVAARAILDTAAEHFLAEGRRVTAGWPDLLPVRTSDAPWPSAPEWLKDSSVGRAVLERLGWRQASWDEWASPDVYYIQDDGWEHSAPTARRYTRNAIGVADGHIADSINNAVASGACLPYAVVDESRGAKIRFTDLRKAKSGEWGEVWLAEAIKVGQYQLPFLLTTVTRKNGRWAEDIPVAVLACDADMAVDAVTGKPACLPAFEEPVEVGYLIAGYLVCSCEDQALYEAWTDWPVNGDDAVNWDAIRKDLVEQISDDFIGGRVAKAPQKVHALEAHLETLDRLSTRVNFDVPNGAYGAYKKAILSAMARMEKRLRKDVAATKKIARMA